MDFDDKRINPGGSRSWLTPLLALILIALVIRIVAWWVACDSHLVGDEVEYDRMARLFASGKNVRETSRPPLSWAPAGLIYQWLGHSLPLARAINVPLSALLLVPVFLIAREIGGQRAGLWAAAFTALCPELIAYSHLIWSETQYTLLSFVGLAALLRARKATSLWPALGAGILLGAACLTREVGVAFVPVAVFWLLRWKRRSGALILALASGLIVIPWVVHINRESDHALIMIDRSWMTMYIGNSTEYGHHSEQGRMDLRLQYESFGRSNSKRESEARRAVIERVMERMPAWPFQKLVSETPAFMTPNSFPIARLMARHELQTHESPTELARRRAYDLSPSWLEQPAVLLGLIAILVLGWIALAMSGIAGLVLAGEHTSVRVLASFAFIQFLPAVAAFSLSRFRIACLPALAVGAAVLLVGSNAANISRSRRVVACSAALIALALIALSWSHLNGMHWS